MTDYLKTSVKKLTPLARQIAGKSVDEAINQMRFSKKRVAEDVRDHLVLAKNRATVLKGMGLGEAEGRMGNSVSIELKDGTRKLVTDQTAMYIDQAWVNRGLFTRSRSFRARGRVDTLRHPSTSKFSVKQA